MLKGIFILKFQGYKSGLDWLHKLVPTCGVQVGEMQPSFVPLLEGSAIGTGTTSMKGGNCMICLSLLLKYYIPSTHLLLLRCFCFCKMLLRGFCYLLPDTVTVSPCTKNPRGQMSMQSNSLVLPQALTALSVRQCPSLCRSGSVLTHASGASDPQDMAFSALAARMWPRFLLNGSALRGKVPTQHSSAADIAQTDCLQSLEPLSPWGSVIGVISFSRSGWDLLCKSPLPPCKVTSVRRGNHSPLASAVLFSLSGYS